MGADERFYHKTAVEPGGSEWKNGPNSKSGLIATLNLPGSLSSDLQCSAEQHCNHYDNVISIVRANQDNVSDRSDVSVGGCYIRSHAEPSTT